MNIAASFLIILTLVASPLISVEDKPALTEKCGLPPDRLDCTPTLDCTHPRDERECNFCLIKNPFGGCALRTNDPACEAAKASQNTLYDSQKAICEAQKAQQKATCEATKAALALALAKCKADQE